MNRYIKLDLLERLLKQAEEKAERADAQSFFTAVMTDTVIEEEGEDVDTEDA